MFFRRRSVSRFSFAVFCGVAFALWTLVSLPGHAEEQPVSALSSGAPSEVPDCGPSKKDEHSTTVKFSGSWTKQVHEDGRCQCCECAPPRHEDAGPTFPLCERRLLAPLRAYLHVDELDAWNEAAAGGGDGGIDAAWGAITAKLDEQNIEVDVVLATVPDPVETSYLYHFDRTFRAIQLGIEEPLDIDGGQPAGYLRDQAWLPWDDRHLQDPKRRPAIEECRRQVPGIQIFRSAEAAEKHRLRVALFVGETPQEGVHKEALHRAAKAAFDVMRCGGKGRDQGRCTTLNVLGPSYSGSMASLRTSLASAMKTWTWKNINMISGSATSRGAIREATVATDAGTTLTYQITTIDDTSAESLFFPWLAEREGVLPVSYKGDEQHQLRDVALLTESGTAFGRRGQSMCAAGKSPCRPELILSFPRGIAALEREYSVEERRDDAGAPASTPIPRARRAALDPSLDERIKPRDTELDPSPKVVLAQDIELTNLLSEVSRRGIRYLAIRSTDAADAVFLARRVRVIAPDVRLVFFSSDVLLLHPSFTADLVGSFVVSPYPFFGTSQLASPASHAKSPWEGQAAQGIFNATVALMAGDAGPDLPSYLSEYEIPLADGGAGGGSNARSTPGALLPLWVATIGRDGIYPVDVSAPSMTCRPAFFPVPQGAVDCIPAGGPVGKVKIQVDDDVTPPRGWSFGLFALVLVSVTEFIVFYRGRGVWLGPSHPIALLWRMLLPGRRSDAGADPADLAAESIMDPPSVLSLQSPRRSDDLMVLRAKYLVYGALRGTVLVATATYAALLDTLARRTFQGNHPFPDFRIQDLVSMTTLWRIWEGFVAWVYPSVLLLLIVATTFRVITAAVAFWQCPRQFDDLPVGRTLRELFRGSPPSEKTVISFHRLHGIGVLGALFALSMLLTILCVVEAKMRLFHWDFSPTVEGVAFVLRSLPTTAGVSPAVVIVLLGLGLAAWTSGRLARLSLTYSVSLLAPREGRRAPTPISDIVGAADSDVRVFEQQLVHVLQRPAAFLSSALVSALIFAVPIVAFGFKGWSTLETRTNGRAIMFFLTLCAALTAMSTQHLVEFYSSLWRLLHRLRTWSQAACLDRAAGIVGWPVSYLVTRHYDEGAELACCVEAFRDFRAQVVLGGREESLANTIEQEAAVVALARANGVSSEKGRGVNLGPCLVKMAGLVREQLAVGAPSRWPALASAAAEAPTDPPAAWRVAGERFVACVMGLFIARYVRHVRYYMQAISTTSIVLVVAVSAYPFQPHRLFLITSWILVLSVVASGLFVFVGLERNTVLSRLAGKNSGEIPITRDVVLRFVTWVALPLLAVFSAQYPAVASVVGAVLEPFSRAFK
jgi:hypothetical protein